MCCRVGQQSQDGGQTVQFLLDVLWQLLVLLISVKRTDISKSSGHIYSSANGK